MFSCPFFVNTTFVSFFFFYSLQLHSLYTGLIVIHFLLYGFERNLGNLVYERLGCSHGKTTQVEALLPQKQGHVQAFVKGRCCLGLASRYVLVLGGQCTMSQQTITARRSGHAGLQKARGCILHASCQPQSSELQSSLSTLLFPFFLIISALSIVHFFKCWSLVSDSRRDSYFRSTAKEDPLCALCGVCNSLKDDSHLATYRGYLCAASLYIVKCCPLVVVSTRPLRRLCRNSSCDADLFIALNVIRIISIVSLVLVFASNIETLVHDVVAVNNFITAVKGSDPMANNTQVQDSDYILCVYLFDSLRLPCLPDIDHVQGKHSPQPACRRVLGCSQQVIDYRTNDCSLALRVWLAIGVL